MSYYTTDPNVIIQRIAKHQFGHTLVNVPQFQGSHYATVVDTDATNKAVSKGNMRVIIPSLSQTDVWEEIPYHGIYAPPNKTVAVVAFEPGSQKPICHGFIGHQPGQLLYGSGVPSSSKGNIGDTYINVANSQIYGPKSTSGWGAGTQMHIPKAAVTGL